MRIENCEKSQIGLSRHKSIHAIYFSILVGSLLLALPEFGTVILNGNGRTGFVRSTGNFAIGNTTISNDQTAGVIQLTTSSPIAMRSALYINSKPSSMSRLNDNANEGSGFADSANHTLSGLSPFIPTSSIAAAENGIGPANPFGLMGLSKVSTAYRSREILGLSDAFPGAGFDAPNTGLSGTTAFISLNYSPVKSGIAALCAAACLLAGKRRRR